MSTVFGLIDISAAISLLVLPKSIMFSVYGAASTLYKVDPDAGTFTSIGYYGLGAGEHVNDLASSTNGKLYAAVIFNISYASDYLATLDTKTGTMNIIGNTYINGLNAITEKDGVLYGMNSSGDLYSIDKTSGASTLLASAVIPGARGNLYCNRAGRRTKQAHRAIPALAKVFRYPGLIHRSVIPS